MLSCDLLIPRYRDHAHQVLKELELTAVAEEKIGNVALGGLSPELRKKVTIAVELVTGPSILFLDEPTTGLPAAAAYEVMTTVRKLANDICVICTIHQVGPSLFLLVAS